MSTTKKKKSQIEKKKYKAKKDVDRLESQHTDSSEQHANLKQDCEQAEKQLKK